MASTNKIIMLVLTAVIFISFFLPWVSVESETVGKIAKLFTDKNVELKMQPISAFQVPVLANSDESRLMISIIKLFNPNITNADKKSYLIWAIPLLAVAILAVIWFLGSNKWVNLGFGILGCLIFIVVVFKLSTTNLDKIVLKVNIGLGVWLTIIGYLGIGLLCLVNFIALSRKK